MQTLSRGLFPSEALSAFSCKGPLRILLLPAQLRQAAAGIVWSSGIYQKWDFCRQSRAPCAPSIPILQGCCCAGGSGLLWKISWHVLSISLFSQIRPLTSMCSSSFFSCLVRNMCCWKEAVEENILPSPALPSCRWATNGAPKICIILGLHRDSDMSHQVTACH